MITLNGIPLQAHINHLKGPHGGGHKPGLPTFLMRHIRDGETHGLPDLSSAASVALGRRVTVQQVSKAVSKLRSRGVLETRNLNPGQRRHARVVVFRPAQIMASRADAAVGSVA